MEAIPEPTSKLKRIFLRFKKILQPSGDINKKRILRRKAIVRFLTHRLTLIKLVFFRFRHVHAIFKIVFPRVTLFAVGYLWMLAIPFPGLGRETYIDENALQPSQVWRRKSCPMLSNILFRLIRIGTGIMSMLQTYTLLNWSKSATLTSRANSQTTQSLGPSTFSHSFSRRAQFLSTELLRLGLFSSTQNYGFSASTVVCTFSYCGNLSNHSVSPEY